MAAQPDYFSPWQRKKFPCKCGWSGTSKMMGTELFAELVEYSCPNCEAHLILVTLPTHDQVKEAAAAGDREARSMLKQALDSERRVADRERTALREPAQLPDVPGDSIAFVWDIEGRSPDYSYVITAGEQSVWRERASFEDWRRFEEVKVVFKAKYGARFKSLTPTDGAMFNLLGDNISTTLKPT